MRRIIGTAIAAAALAACAPAAGAAEFPGFQADAAHSGHQAGESFRPPLTRVWSRDLEATVSHPLIASGRVFVNTSRNSDHAAELVALDASNGRTLWSQSLEPTDNGWTGAAYGGGLVYAVNGGGLVRAFRPDSGAEVWRRQLDAGVHAAPPTFSDGVLYLSAISSYEKVTEPEENAYGGAYALRASDGAVLWRRVVIGGSSSSPSLDATTFYANYTCGQVYALDRATGAIRWHRNPGCYGGGGRTTALYAGELWVLEPDDRDFEVFDAGNGTLLRNVPPTHNPAFADGIGFFARNDAFVAIELKTGRQLWAKPRGYPPAEPGPQWSTPPLVVNGVVYEGTVEGVLYAFDIRSGEQLWSEAGGAGFVGDNPSSVAQPTSGLGAGEGLLIAPHTKGVIAYRGEPSSTAPPSSEPPPSSAPPPSSSSCRRVRSKRRPRVVCKLTGAPTLSRRAPARLTRGRTVLARGFARTVRGALRADLIARGTQLPPGNYALRISRRGGGIRAIVRVP
jgi:outer membrane protein assembly factor BamB